MITAGPGDDNLGPGEVSGIRPLTCTDNEPAWFNVPPWGMSFNVTSVLSHMIVGIPHPELHITPKLSFVYISLEFSDCSVETSILHFHQSTF